MYIWSGTKPLVCASVCACTRVCWYGGTEHKCIHVLVYAPTHDHALKPQMYPPAGGQRGAPAASSQSGQQRETAGRWCWRFGSEPGACYGRTTLLPSAVRSHRRRRKLVKGTNEGGMFHKGQRAEQSGISA